jgi:hypothetical protein
MRLGTTITLAAMMAVSTAAKADTIYLKCENFFPFAIDLTNKTVNGNPATITPIAIDWVNVNQTGEIHSHIDRTNGTLLIFGTYHLPQGDTPVPQSTYNCEVQSAPQTKF